MNARLLHLKVKIKHLAAESRIIRQEEVKMLARMKKCKADGYDREQLEEIHRSLYEHRVNKGYGRSLRGGARANGLAYAFLKGKEYKEVENSTREPIPSHIMREALKVAKTFSNEQVLADDMWAWFRK